MAIKAIWIPNTSYAPADDRLGLGALLAPGGTDQTSFLSVRSGVIPAPAASTGGPLRVVPGGARTVNVNIGQIVVPAGATVGAYIVSNDSSLNIALPTAHATLARIDVVYVLVSDTSNGGGSDSVTITSVTGTPAASPAVPAIPAGAIELGRINVTAGLTTVTTGNITDSRVFTAPLGGILPITSTTRPLYGYEGQHIFETDTGKVYKWYTGAWTNTASAGSATSGLSSSRPASANVGDRYYETDTGIEWVWRSISGTGYWVPPNGTLVAVLGRTGGEAHSGEGYVNWDAEQLDILGGHSVSSNTNRFNTLVPGRYKISVTLDLVCSTIGNAGENVATRAYLNGTAGTLKSINYGRVPANTTVHQSFTLETQAIDCVATDYLAVTFGGSSSSNSYTVSPGQGTFMQISYHGPATGA